MNVLRSSPLSDSAEASPLHFFNLSCSADPSPVDDPTRASPVRDHRRLVGSSLRLAELLVLRTAPLRARPAASDPPVGYCLGEMPVDCHDTNSSPDGRFAQIAVKRSGTVRSWPAELKAKRDILLLMIERIDFLRTLSHIGAGVGLILTVVGFTLWYKKVQIYQDRALRETKKR
jgi:hypothetical protein